MTADDDIAELRAEIVKLQKEVQKLKGGQGWYDKQLENFETRLRRVESILGVKYDEEKDRWISTYLNKMYGMIKHIERKKTQKQKTS